MNLFVGDWHSGPLIPLGSIRTQWHIEDRSEPNRSDGWYVIRPDGGDCGPFTEDEASRQLPILQVEYPLP